MNTNARYVRREDFESRIDHVELPVEAWTVFAELAEARTTDELQTRTDLSPGTVRRAIDQLIEHQLVRKLAISWRDFTALQPAGKPASAPDPAPIAAVRSFETPEPRPAVTHAPASRPTRISFRLSAADAPAPRLPAISLRISATGAAPLVAPKPAPAKITAWKLRPVLDAIGTKAGGGVAGQLLIYRVFLQIPTELMQAAGLHSLSLVKNDFTVTHPEFRGALAEAALRHADVDIDQLPAA